MGDLSSALGLKRFPGGWNGTPLQYSCLKNPMTEESGRLQSMRLQRIRHDWTTNTLNTFPKIPHLVYQKAGLAILQIYPEFNQFSSSPQQLSKTPSSLSWITAVAGQIALLLQLLALRFSTYTMARIIFQNLIRDFPGGPVVKSPPSNAGDVGSIPSQGTKILHVEGQLGPCATTGDSPDAAMKTLHSQHFKKM